MLTRSLLLAIVALVLAPAAAGAAPTHYVSLPDGVQIAMNVKVPAKCTAASPCPTFFEMSGYESGSDEGKTPAGHLADQTGLPLPLQTGTRAAHAARAGIDERYVTVLASVRGTGCSSGEFDLFSQRSALDGKYVIDQWIAKQPWSDGDVVIFGHSYSGLTGMLVAATRPEHLRAVTASGLFGDVYRDIVYPGGVSNYGFPLLWTGGVRVAYDVGGGTVGGLYPVEEGSSEQCALNQAARSRTLTDEPLVHGVIDTDTEWSRVRSLVSHVGRIEVPVHITTASQDEQTGGRGPTNVFDALDDDVSKRLVLVNGVHGTQTEDHVWKDRVAWMDYWMLGHERANFSFVSGDVTLSKVFGKRNRPTTTSRVILGNQGGGKAVGEVESDGWPFGQVRWRRLHVSEGGELVRGRENVEDYTGTWVNGSRRQSYSYQGGVDNGGELSSPDGPDELSLVKTFKTPTAVVGPVLAKLRVASTAPDTELFVQVIDRAPDGSLLYLNRGLLRGSHRQIDRSQSQVFRGVNYRPYRPHTARALAAPGETVTYKLDVWPFGHVFLPGHQLLIKLHAPPADDNDYMYIQKTLPGANTLTSTTAEPSTFTLPVVPFEHVRGFKAPPAPCAYASMRCIGG